MSEENHHYALEWSEFYKGAMLAKTWMRNRICIVRKRECVNQVGNVKLTKNNGIENKVEK